MDDLISMIYVSGNLLETFVRLFVFALCIDCCFGVAQCFGSIKRSVL